MRIINSQLSSGKGLNLKMTFKNYSYEKINTKVSAFCKELSASLNFKGGHYQFRTNAMKQGSKPLGTKQRVNTQ